MSLTRSPSYTVTLVVVVVPEPGKYSVGALSEGLGPIGEPEIAELSRRVLGAVEHQAMALAVAHIVQYDALFLVAVDVDHYNRLDGLERGHVTRGVRISSAVHDQAVHVDATVRVSHVRAPREVALQAQRNRRQILVVVARGRKHHRQSHQRDEPERIHFGFFIFVSTLD